MRDLVSIIMPAYNAEAYIADAIRSVLNQSHENWELLIVNDGSTDNTASIAESFLDTRIKTITQKNQGVSSARNNALARMTGSFFCFLDADDQLPINSIFERLKIFTNPEVHFVDGQVKIFNHNMSEVMETRNHNFSGYPLNKLCEIDASCFFGPTWMIRVITGEKYQFKHGLTHGEELLFYIGIAHHGAYQAVQTETYYYRSGHLSAMSDMKGLENGYKNILKELKSIPHVTAEMQKAFRKRSRSIMFKSYLGSMMPIAAIRSWISFLFI